jgi:hypothetical protein
MGAKRVEELTDNELHRMKRHWRRKLEGVKDRNEFRHACAKFNLYSAEVRRRAETKPDPIKLDVSPLETFDFTKWAKG